MKKQLAIFAAATLMSAALLLNPAYAAFVLSNSSGGDGYVTVIPGGVDLFGGNNGQGQNYTTYLDTAASAQTLTFAWTYTTNDCCGSVYDPAGYVVNDIYHQLSVDFNGNQGDGNASGIVTLNVGAGQDYGFYVFTTDGILGPADIAVTSGVPEASTWVMLLLGFAALGWVGHRRRNAMSPSVARDIEIAHHPDITCVMRLESNDSPAQN